MDDQPKLFERLRAGISKFHRSYLLARLFGRQKMKKLMAAEEPPMDGAGQEKSSQPVDAVFLWKDDSDPVWVEKERRHLKEFDVKYYINQLQFFNPEPKPVLDELRYSLRSLERYFVDLGNVYIVTDGQRPAWLKPDHPRLKVVDIADIIDDPAYLPNYNSQAIESYLYRIAGLSEHFIYLNDDFFIASELHFSDFFTADSKIKVRLGRGLSPKGDPENSEDGDVSAHKNSNAVLDARFKREDRLTVMHRPYTLTKTLMKESLRQFPEEFHQTRKSRFRSTKMYGLHNCLVPYAAYYQGRAQLVPPSILEKDMYFWTNSRGDNDKIVRELTTREHEGFCIQEDRSLTLTEQSVQQFHEMMCTLFPKKSGFEK